MRRSILSISLALPTLFLCAALAPSPVAPPCANVIPHEPVVLYEVTGYTFCCLVDLQLTVWNDGSVRVASAEDSSGRAQVAVVDPLDVQALLADLNALGAGFGCDQTDSGADIPLSTLTVLRGSTDGRAHTWSWYYDDGHGQAIAGRLEQFLQNTFPGF